MHKLFGLILCAVALAACSNMSGTRSMGNTAETKNSTDANKSSNPAAVSPGGGGAGSAGAGTGPGGAPR